MPRSLFLALVTVAAFTSPATPQSSQHLQAVDDALLPLIDEGHFPGVAIAILQDGEPIHIGTHGLASIELDAPITEHSVFELASLTKQMTALAVMTMVEQGKLSLDDELSTFLDAAPEDWSGINVNQLLSHMAGLDHHFEQKVNDSYLLDYSTDEMLASAMSTPLLSEPGSDWAYSDQGYFLLGLIIEAVSGERFEDHMRSAFFDPSGMNETRLLDQSAIIPGRVEGYAFENGLLKRNRRVWQFELTSHFGVMSSLHDMMEWEAALRDSEIVSEDALEKTWQIKRPFDTGQTCDSWGYARGWWSSMFEGKRILTHAGYSGTAYIRSVDDGLSVIVLTNRQDGQGLLSPMALAWAAAHIVAPDLPDTGLRCWE